jgi:hypothetical protein
VKRLALAAALAVLSLGGGFRLDAGAEPPPEKDWEVEILPYVWALSADGKFEKPNGADEHFHITTRDVLEALDLGAMGRVNVRWHRWVLVGDGIWAKLSEDQDFGRGPLKIDGDFDQTLGLAQVLGGFRVFKRPGGLFGTLQPGDERLFGIDLLGGINYTYVSASVDLDLKPVGPFPGRQRNFGSTNQWVAPAVGLRFVNDFTPRWRLETLGAVGGFGVGDAADLSWQLTTLLSYRFTDHWLVSVGHRLIDVEGNEGNDLRMHGAILGVGYRF